MEFLDYVEQQADKTTAFHLETIETLNKRAHTLVTVLLGGAGTVGTVAVSMAEKGASWWALVSLFTTMAWLFFVAGYVVRKGLMAGRIFPPGNEPCNLLPGEDDLPSLRREELRHVDVRIKGYAARNFELATALDYAYQLTAATPLSVAALVVVVWMVRAAVH